MKIGQFLTVLGLLAVIIGQTTERRNFKAFWSGFGALLCVVAMVYMALGK